MYNVLPTQTDLTPSNEPFIVWDLNDFLDSLASGDNPSRTVKDLDLNYLAEFHYVPSIDEAVFLAISLDLLWDVFDTSVQAHAPGRCSPWAFFPGKRGVSCFLFSRALFREKFHVSFSSSPLSGQGKNKRMSSKKGEDIMSR